MFLDTQKLGVKGCALIKCLVVFNMWSCKVKFDEEKSKYASLALERDFGST
jgi:hypothetical protein